jgi:hypothetical protein
VAVVVVPVVLVVELVAQGEQVVAVLVVVAVKVHSME